MANKKTAKLIVEKPPNQKIEDATAEIKLNSSFLGMAVIDAFKSNVQGEDLELTSAYKVLAETTQKIRSNDLSSLEEMLFNQSKALEQIFVSMVRRAKAQEHLLQFQAHFNLALKAQNQSRATLQALIQLKQPNQTAFIKQTNIAHGHQQVNNSLENNPFPQNELLEEELDVSQKMDSRATIKAK
jgi:hypothetical protein